MTVDRNITKLKKKSQQISVQPSDLNHCTINKYDGLFQIAKSTTDNES